MNESLWKHGNEPPYADLFTPIVYIYHFSRQLRAWFNRTPKNPRSVTRVPSDIQAAVRRKCSWLEGHIISSLSLLLPQTQCGLMATLSYLLYCCLGRMVFTSACQKAEDQLDKCWPIAPRRAVMWWSATSHGQNSCSCVLLQADSSSKRFSPLAPLKYLSSCL